MLWRCESVSTPAFKLSGSSLGCTACGWMFRGWSTYILYLAVEFHRAANVRVCTGLASKELELAQPKRQNIHDAPSCPLSKFTTEDLCGAYRGEPMGHDYTHDYKNHSTAWHDQFFTRKSQLEDSLVWWPMDGEIEPAWKNYYELQGKKPTATCSECGFKELCVLASFKPPCIYVYIYIYIYTHTHIYIYTYIQ